VLDPCASDGNTRPPLGVLADDLARKGSLTAPLGSTTGSVVGKHALVFSGDAYDEMG
jgi:hypothetical protein